MALEKAGVAARQAGDDCVVIGADTIVVLDGQVLGKPDSPEEAGHYLRMLRGRWHEVITGLAVLETVPGDAMKDSSRTYAGPGGTSARLVGARHETTRVMLRPFTDDEIRAYVESGDPMDKAGAYAIQNEDFHPVQAVTGSWSNVVGLPLGLTAELLKAAGVVVPSPPALASDEPDDR
jgi:MAF protein